MSHCGRIQKIMVQLMNWRGCTFTSQHSLQFQYKNVADEIFVLWCKFISCWPCKYDQKHQTFLHSFLNSTSLISQAGDIFPGTNFSDIWFFNRWWITQSYLELRMLTTSTLSLLFIGILPLCYCGEHNVPHQERQSRLIPNYQPFQHPAKKILPTPAAEVITGSRASGNLV